MLPTSTASHLDRARELLRLEKFELALEAAREAAAAAPTSADPHAVTAWILRRMRRLADAEAAARYGLSLEPTDGDVQHALAVVLWDRNKPGESEQLFKSAIATGAWASWLYLCNYARFLVARKRPAEGLEAADEAVRRMPHDETPHESRGMALYALGRNPEAELALREALRIDPQSALALEYMGKVALATGQFAEAADHFRAQLRLTPSDRDGRMGLVTALKARYPIYGLVLLITQWVNRVANRRYRNWYVIALTLLFACGFGVARVNKGLGSILVIAGSLMLLPLICIWLLRMIWRWVGEPVFNTLLALDPQNRAIIDYDSVDAVISGGLAFGLVFGPLLLANTMIRARPAVTPEIFAALAILLVITLVAVGGLKIYQRSWQRKTILGSYAGFLGGALLLVLAVLVTGAFTPALRSPVGGLGTLLVSLCADLLIMFRVIGALVLFVKRVTARSKG